MPFLISRNALLISGLCVINAVFSESNQAQTSEGVITGQIGGMEVQIQGNRALFKNEGRFQAEDTSSLSELMQKKGISQLEIQPDRMTIYRNHTEEPDRLYFPLLIEPTPTSTGIEIIDQSTGLFMLNSQIIKLASTVISETPSLNPQRRYTGPESDPTYEIAFFEDDENELHATMPVPVATPVPSTTYSQAKEESYIDLDFENLNTIRVYPKGKSNNSASGSFEQLIRKTPNGKKDDEPEKQGAGSSTQSSESSTDGSIASTSVQAVGAATVAPTPVALSEISDPGNKPAATPDESPLAEFKPYHSIENSSRERSVYAIRRHGAVNQEWVVTEKIHGANYSFWTNGVDVKVARRRGWISDDEKFYAHSSVREKYEKHVLAMHNKFCKKGDILTVTGELYGGTVMQNSINYGGELNFAAFDIFVNNKKRNYDVFKKWTEAMGIPRVPELAILPSLDEALHYSPAVVSSLSEAEHLAEGIVIKPVAPYRLPAGNYAILKIKNPEYSETATAEKPAKSKPAKSKQVSEENQSLLAALTAEITETRLTSVRSKTGEVTEANFKKIQGSFIQDAVNSYNSKSDEKAQDNRQWRLIRQKLEERAAELMRKLPELN